MFGGAGAIVFENAKRLRHTMTDTEMIVWGYLKTSPSGFKFRRQHPFGLYIADFYCHRLKLVVEIDGSIHNVEAIKANDIIRQQTMEAEGLTFVRFTNTQVLENLSNIISALQKAIDDRSAR